MPHDDKPSVIHLDAKALPRLVRCQCEVCGAHINAVKTYRVIGSCATCGSFRIVPLEGAAVMAGSRRVA